MAEPVDGNAEARRRIGDANVAAASDLHPAARAHALDRRHRRVEAAGERAQGIGHDLAVFARLGGVGADVGEFGNIGAGGKGPVA